MKKISLILLFLGVFLLPTTAVSAISDDACAPQTDATIVLSDSNTTYSATVPIIDGDSHLYYIYVATPGKVTISLSNTANKVSMNTSDSSCPTAGTSYLNPDDIIIQDTTSFDFNLNINANGTNAQYTLDITFEPAPVAITKTAYPGQVAVDTNTSVTYTIDVTNNLGEALTDLIFTDTLPAGVTLNSIVTPAGWNCGDINNSLPEITCITSSIPGGQTETFTLDTIINSSSDVYNTAELEAAGKEKVGSTAIVRAVSGTKEVDLEIQKYAEGENILPNTSFRYLFFVVNHSQSADAELVTITDTFPSDINITGYDNSTGWTCTIPPPDGNNTFTCDFNRSLGHEITYFTVQATTGPSFQDNVTNYVEVDALNPISGDHNTFDTATINITDQNLSGGTIGGRYIKGGSIEVSDILFGDRLNAQLQTKVASTENITIKTYFVNLATRAPEDYLPPSYDPTTNTNIIPVTVILKLADDDCTIASETYLSYDGSPVTAVFEPDNDEFPDIKNAGSDAQANPDTTTFTMRNIGQRKARLIMKYVDINEKLDYSGESCSVSNLSSNIKGLPQCIANSGGSTTFDNNKYINVFGIEAFIRCNLLNGQPCSSENNGVGDDPYDHEYGCYECTIGSEGFCSNDNFAIRPRAFDVNITNGDFFRAGKDYSLDFRGLTANTSIPNETTLDYNETQIPPGSTGTPDNNGTTPGGITATTESKTFSIDMNVTDNTNCQVKYLTNDPLVKFRDGLDIGPFKFDDIGNINFSMHETVGTEFAIVDENDTDVVQRLIQRYDVNFTVIPDHFDITATLTDQNNATNLTYLHDINEYDQEDNYTMASDLTIDIKAMGEDDNITSNYTEQCYAKNTDLTLGLNGTNIIYPGTTVPLTHFLYYNPVEDNGSINSGEGNYTLPAPVGNTIALPTLPIENTVSSFPENAPDGNGTTHLEYKLNFDRKIHLVVNPVKMELSDVNITEVDTTVVPSNIVKGETGALTGQNAHFYYARTRASKFFYEDISDANVNTPIIVDRYCDLGFATCDSLGIDTVNGQINEINWWLSPGHNTGNNDGNITLMKGAVLEGSSADWSVTPTVNITANAIDQNIVVNRGTNPTLPLTVEIDLDTTNPLDTNRWLIYNPDTDDIVQAPPSPLYKVRFIGTSGWAGHGDTRHVVESNASKTKNRRLGW